ncbi:hypothetical protein [Paenibacillus hamazuiensis]|uniref:hypothetical protein n=1 Tax=Paenibacillus hamazuiensis TaxID=2936508 RepID=UPI00200EF481|nr:hypothetical protein [Paenibacillus hamazuiensis]
MILPISMIVAILILAILVTVPKNMHLFELFFNSFTLNYLHTYLFSIFTNLKLITVSEGLDREISFILIRFILNPVLLLLLLQIYMTLRSFLAKMVFILVCSAIFTLIHSLMKAFSLVNFAEPVILWVFLGWLVMLLICIAAMSWFRSILRKEVFLP